MTLLHETTSLCRSCKNALPARVVERDGAVWMEKDCPAHGAQEVRLSDDAAWYERTRAVQPLLQRPARVRREVHHGCPFDCGPCETHEARVRLPVVTITSACNLDCPICYVHNKNEHAFHMELEDVRRTLEHLREDQGGELDIVNFTGGEPTVHPRFLEVLALARDMGVRRTTVCTNGVRLARDESLVAELARLGARVALSFDTFEHAADVKLQGTALLPHKLRCLDLLEKHGVDTTLIPVMTRGVNEHEIGKIVQLALGKRNIRHVEVHTITFTGQGGTSFDRSTRMSIREVLAEIEETTAGALRVDDFVSSPCAHPLCYQIAYLLVDPAGGPPIPFARFMPRQAVYEALAEHLYLEPSPGLEASLREAIDRLWTSDEPDAERTLGLLKGLLLELFPADRVPERLEALRRGERAAKAIYVHSHMDEETFDVERAIQCCDSNCYPDGTQVPVCNYNVLYREKEPRFNVAPRTWNERSGGRRLDVVS